MRTIHGVTRLLIELDEIRMESDGKLGKEFFVPLLVLSVLIVT
jgi:hypothetical protein